MPYTVFSYFCFVYVACLQSSLQVLNSLLALHVENARRLYGTHALPAQHAQNEVSVATSHLAQYENQ
jgi:hypothetical protein